MKVEISGLDDAIQNELNEWAKTDLRKAANESFKETAQEAAKMLKQGGPYTERTGRYTKDWTSGTRESRASAITGLTGYSVCNKKNYQLTHLLEFGHQSRNGGRVKAFSHIAAVNEQAAEMAASKIQRKIGG